MTQAHTISPLIAIQLAEAVGGADVATIRQISTDNDFTAIQVAGTQVYITTLLLLNSMDKGEFPNDVWHELPRFLMSDVPERAIILGCQESMLENLVGGFLKNNVLSTVRGQEAAIFDPSHLQGGHFTMAATIGEAVYALLKVGAKKRFSGDYNRFKKFVVDSLELQAAVAADA